MGFVFLGETASERGMYDGAGHSKREKGRRIMTWEMEFQDLFNIRYDFGTRNDGDLQWHIVTM
jgi:hypothetical protein